MPDTLLEIYPTYCTAYPSKKPGTICNIKVNFLMPDYILILYTNRMQKMFSLSFLSASLYQDIVPVLRSSAPVRLYNTIQKDA